MIYTIDSSIWVNSCDQREEGYAASRQMIAEMESRGIAVILPTLALVEIAGAISRSRTDAQLGFTFAQAVAARPNVSLVNLPKGVAQQASVLAAHHRLRGADAVYAAVAQRMHTTLVSRDREHLTRLIGVVVVQTPEQVLAGLATG